MSRPLFTERRKLWLARLLIGVVLGWNWECALAFLWRPGDYTAGFELTGASGLALVRGLGVLFLMWNVPYAFAFWHPRRQRTSLLEALIMQAIGLLGETALCLSLPPGHMALRSTAARFILFDGLGLALLAGAAWLSRRGTLQRDPLGLDFA